MYWINEREFMGEKERIIQDGISDSVPDESSFSL
jgi:hypothetical protein